MHSACIVVKIFPKIIDIWPNAYGAAPEGDNNFLSGRNLQLVSRLVRHRSG